jgi:hypothetical protein
MPNPPLPWFKLWGGVTSSSKVAPLNDALFRTWVELLDAASQQPTRQRGRFANRKAAAAIVRRPLSHVTALVGAGLVDETTDGLTMHDWDDWQRWRKEDVIDSRSTTDQLTNNNGSAHERPPNGHMINTPPLREDVRRKTLDVKTKDEENVDVDEDPPSPPRGKRGKPARQTFSDEDEFALVSKWRDDYGGERAVHVEIMAALNHNGRFKCQSERLYVDRWLSRELRFRGGYRNGTTPVAEAECTCDEVRANLAINRNSYPNCDVHGRIVL